MKLATAPIRELEPNIGTEILIPVTNAIESLNRVIRKSIKTRGSFPADEAATKSIYLAIRKFEKDISDLGGNTSDDEVVVTMQETEGDLSREEVTQEIESMNR